MQVDIRDLIANAASLVEPMRGAVLDYLGAEYKKMAAFGQIAQCVMAESELEMFDAEQVQRRIRQCQDN